MKQTDKNYTELITTVILWAMLIGGCYYAYIISGNAANGKPPVPVEVEWTEAEDKALKKTMDSLWEEVDGYEERNRKELELTLDSLEFYLKQ